MKDEFDGIGGSYVVDPKTGKRTLVERTKETHDAPVKQQTHDKSDDAKGD